MTGAEVIGASLVLTYDEALDGSSVPAESAYTVKVDGGAGSAPSSVTISGSKVTLTLASAVPHAASVTVSYTVPSLNPVQDAEGQDAAAFDDSAVTNNTAAPTPRISDIQIRSRPFDGGTYLQGHLIEVVVIFDRSVKVAGRPRLALQIGGNTRNADFAGLGSFESLRSSGMTFHYTVQSDDADTDGISIPADPLRLNAGTIASSRDSRVNADLTHAAVADDSTHMVDGTMVPTPTATVAFSSRPLTGNTYRRQEKIVVVANFNYQVDVTGTPRVALTVGTRTRYANFIRYDTFGHSRYRKRVLFEYVVQSGDSDTDGVDIPMNALQLNGGAVTLINNSGANADLSHDAVEGGSGHKVDGSLQRILELKTFWLSTGEGWPVQGDTYRRGENILVYAYFAEPVGGVIGKPRVALTIGDNTRYAEFARAESKTLLFLYVVQADDVDADGIDIAVDALDLNGGDIFLRADPTARKDLVADSGWDGTDPGHDKHKVNGSLSPTAPVVTGVFFINPLPAVNQTYGIGERVSVAVGFNTEVAVTGTPQIGLQVGNNLRQADLLKVFWTKRYLLFTYTVQSGDADTDGVSIPENSLNLNGGSIHFAEDSSIAAALDHAAVATQSGRKVDGATGTLTTVVGFAAASSSADEDAGTVNVALTLAPAPSAAIVLTYTVGGTASAGANGDFTIANSGQVSIPAGATSATIPVAIRDDGDDEGTETVILTLTDGAAYNLGATKAHTLIIADDEPPDVNLPATTTGEPVGRLVLTGSAKTRLSIAWPPVTGAEGYEVRWWKRSASREKSRQRVTDNAYTLTGLEPGTEYVVRAFFVLDGAVRNDKASPPFRVWTRGTEPRLDVADASVDEAPGARLAFRVSLSEAATNQVTVAYATRDRSAKAGADYTATRGTLTFAAGDTEKTVYVPVMDDAHDEGRETLELVLSEARGAPLARAVATGTIVNTDPMPAAWLARLGRTVAEQALDAVAGRIAADRTAGMTGQLAGQSLPNVAFGTDGGNSDGTTAARRDAVLAVDSVARRFDQGNRPGIAESQSMTSREALLGSSFSLTGGADGRGGTLAFWGRAAQANFDGEEGTLSLDGEVTTGLLGTDYAAGRWLLGVALATSSGKGGYRDSAGDGDGQNDGRVAMSGKIETTLTAAIPYAALQASERLRLWGTAGYGAGEMTLKPEGAPAMKADIGWTMAAAGARAVLLAPSDEGPALDLISDALWTRTSSEKAADLGATEGDATRMRLGIEGIWQVALEGGGSIVPKLSAGARHDGGDAETGFGVELGGGLAWTDPTLGLRLDVEGRTLITHEADGFKDRGVSAGLSFDPAPATQRGPSLSIRQDWGGQANSGLDALFAPDPIQDRAGAEEKSRWTVEGAYGFPMFANRFVGSPHAGVGLAAGVRDYTIGWRIAIEARTDASDFDFGITATRRESDAAKPEHRVGFEIRATW